MYDSTKIISMDSYPKSQFINNILTKNSIFILLILSYCSILKTIKFFILFSYLLQQDYIMKMFILISFIIFI
jgi:hypothetical protein